MRGQFGFHAGESGLIAGVGFVRFFRLLCGEDALGSESGRFVLKFLRSIRSATESISKNSKIFAD